MLVMVIQVNPTIDKVLYYLVLKVQASVCIEVFVLYTKEDELVSDDQDQYGLRFVSHGMGL
jgi:hypothetical protein